MIESFQLARVKYVPKTLDAGLLYVADEFDIAVHLCACGCGSKITTPLGPTEWKVTEKDGLPTLHPSIGNWQLPCRSHYFIVAGKTRWAAQWSEAQIVAGRNAEQARRQIYYAARTRERKLLVQFWKWLLRIFGF